MQGMQKSTILTPERTSLVQMIYYAYNEKLRDVISKLPLLKQIGFACVQLPPMHKHRPIDNKYPVFSSCFPTSFEIGSDYGNRTELIEFCHVSHIHGISVVVDVCLNFMAKLEDIQEEQWNEAEQPGNEKRLEELMTLLDTAYPPFDRYDFLPRIKKQRFPNTTGLYGNKYQWFDGIHPALKTGTSKVKNILNAFLFDLKSCGVDGFLFNTSSFMPSWILKTYLTNFPSSLNSVELVEKNWTTKLKHYQDICNVQTYLPAIYLEQCFQKDTVFNLKSIHKLSRQNDVVFSLHGSWLNAYDENHNGTHLSIQDAILASIFLISVNIGRVLLLNKLLFYDKNHSDDSSSNIPKSPSRSWAIKLFKDAIRFASDTCTSFVNYPQIDLNKKDKCFLFLEFYRVRLQTETNLFECQTTHFMVFNNSLKAKFITKIENSFIREGQYFQYTGSGHQPLFPVVVKQNIFYSNGYKSLRVPPKSIMFYVIQSLDL